MLRVWIFCAVLVSVNPILYSSIDLDDLAQDFVLESKQIEIPGYPHAFNPSIIRWKGKLLLSFRVIPDPKFTFNSQLGMVWLDKDFQPLGKAQILDTQAEDPYQIAAIPSRSEDARLLMLNDKLYMVYSDNKDFAITRGGFRVYIAEIKHDNGMFTAHNVECIKKYPGANPQIREKNWVPFEYHGELMLAYSLEPHIIFRTLIGQGECEAMCASSGKIEWDFGDLRGGTPALRHGSEYLSIFHSALPMASVQSKEKSMPHYFMGAYTFSAEPPFEITGISAAPIVGKGFYSGKEYQRYWGSVKAIFPCGYIFDDKFIWIAYGKQDHEICIAKLDKNALLKSLVPVVNIAKTAATHTAD